MRIFWKLALRAAVIPGVLGVLLAAFTLAPVDRRPFEKTSYARNARTRLAALGEERGVPESAPLRAGFGRAILTPVLGASAVEPEKGRFRSVPLAGYGSREGRPARGRHDDLWVKAVAFESGGRTGVVISADTLIVPREVAERVVERLGGEAGLGREQIYFGATHTHCGLGGWGEGLVAELFAGGYVAGIREWMTSRFVSAAKGAVADLTLARAGAGGFEAPESVRNRLVGDAGRVDSRFSLLVVRQDDGDSAVLGAYSAHATVLSAKAMEFGGDYPGAWQREVEAFTGGMAVFLAGAMGSHAPKPPEGGHDGVRAMGKALAIATMRAIGGISLTNRTVWDLRGVEVKLPPLQVRVADKIRLQAWVVRGVLPVGASTWLQVLRLGDAVWLSTPCDYSGELALELAESTRPSGVFTTVTSFNGDYVGYVVPSRYYGMNTYETRTMSFHGPQLSGYFDTILQELVRIVTSTESPDE